MTTDTAITDHDRAKALARELNALGYTWRDIAELVGWSPEWTRRNYSPHAGVHAR